MSTGLRAEGRLAVDPTARGRWAALAQVLVLVAASAVLLPAISPGQAVLGGALAKVLFLGRMVVLLGLATWFLRLRRARWRDTGLRRPNWLRFGLAIPGGLLACVVCVGVVQAMTHRLGMPAPNYRMFAPLHGDLPEYLYWLIPVTWGSAAFGEELLFRGFMVNALQACVLRQDRWVAVSAIVIQAVIFGALHLYQGIGGALTAGVIGLVLGFVWLVSGRNLWAGIIVHGLVDTASMTAIYLGAMPR